MHGLMRRLRVADFAALALLYCNSWKKIFASPREMNYSDLKIDIVFVDILIE
jgi:hypothetical protein